MSTDSVDDLHYAEDLLGGAGLLETYCRPTCQAEGDPDPDECMDGDCCGCPCHERGLTTEVPHQRALREMVSLAPWASIRPQPLSNDDRAYHARTCVDLFVHGRWLHQNADTPETAVVDLLSDLRHLADHLDVDFDALNERAAAHHAAEAAPGTENGRYPG